MITLSSFEPELFNRNADQGNLMVLRKQLQWRDAQYEELKEFDVDADFVLIGDSFNAVTKHYQSTLLELAPKLQERLELGRATLLIGSSYEFYLDALVGLPSKRVSKRVSEFRNVSLGEVRAFGYRNTDLESNDLFVKGAFIGTTLFGPVLAKSPDLLRLVLSGLGVTQDLDPGMQQRLDGYLAEIIRTSSAG
jgi:CobQ-like glutamine amidotransferase family enzyme